VTAAVARLREGLADRYRIERELGAGGMATVYLAQDLKHDRKVAVKVLRPELSAVIGATRFLTEIKVTANLQHPHILPLHDSGEVNGTVFYVMPYVEGESLRDRLTREKQLPIADAVRIATEVASALAYAHGHGVIHRDIKPENILLHGGHALVADFGIALAATSAGSRMTETGMSLGTPTYMSPEQALGERTLDARSDVYALGCVLYEMLVGAPPFVGPTAQAIVAKVMTEKPAAPSASRDTVPEALDEAVLTALAKLPADRFATAADFGAAVADGPAGGRAGGKSLGRPVRPSARLPVLTGGLVLAALAAWGWLRPVPPGPRDIGLPPEAPMLMASWHRGFAVSPDGSFLVYKAQTAAGPALWYRSLTDNEARPIPGTEGVSDTPRISPDGSRVAFAADGQVKVADLEAGTVASVAQAATPLGGSWLADDAVFFADNDGRHLRWIDPRTGPRREVEVQYCILPQPIGTGDRVLCGGGADKYASVRDLARPMEKHTIRRASAQGPTAIVLGSDFRLVDNRYLVYLAIDGTLTATRVDAVDWLTAGRSVPLVPMVRRNAYSGAGQFDITPDGTLVYAPGTNADVGRLMRVARDGRTVPVGLPEAPYLRFTPSPDGRRVATVLEGVEGQELRIWSLDDGRYETLDRGFFLSAPAWNPDATRLVYRKMDDPDQGALLLRRLDSPEPPRVLEVMQGPVMSQPSSYLADDALLVGSATEGVPLMLLDPTVTPVGVDSLGFTSLFSSLSPDGRWIAIQQRGTSGIELRSWPSLDRRWMVDPAGFEPRWRSATELAFLVPGTTGVFQVPIGGTGASPVGKREAITEDPRFADTPGWSLAFMPNRDLLYLQSPGENLGHYVRVVPNWVTAMKAAVDAANR
jgi:serine/threonine-protein kinase